jgi:hypothetical protein
MRMGFELRQSEVPMLARTLVLVTLLILALWAYGGGW